MKSLKSKELSINNKDQLKLSLILKNFSENHQLSILETVNNLNKIFKKSFKSTIEKLQKSQEMKIAKAFTEAGKLLKLKENFEKLA